MPTNRDLLHHQPAGLTIGAGIREKLLVFNRKLVYRDGKNEGQKTRLVKGSLIQFVPRDNTLAIFVPDDQGNPRSTWFVSENGHKDDKLIMGMPGNPADVASAVTELILTQNVELRLLDQPVFGKTDLVFEVVNVKKYDA